MRGAGRAREGRGVGLLAMALAGLLLGSCMLAEGKGKARKPTETVKALPSLGEAPLNMTDVYMSVMLDRLLNVDDISYRHESVIYFWWTWVDERAYPQVLNSTAMAQDESYNNGEGCEVRCQTDSTAGNSVVSSEMNACCDGVWIPGFEIVNLYELPDTRNQRSGFQVSPDGRVGYWVSLHAVFYVPMTFSSFPFDTQRLLVELNYGWGDEKINLIPSATSNSMFSAREGDDVSGWGVKNVTVATSRVNMYDRFVGPPGWSYPDDVLPINPHPSLGVGLWGAPLDGNDYNFVNMVTVTISVERFASYHLLNTILPIVLNTLLVFTVFFVPKVDLPTRMSIVVTLFLALTAVQFVINAALPSSSSVTPPSALILVSYATLAWAGIESTIVFYVVTWHLEAAGWRAALRARNDVREAARRRKAKIRAMGKRAKIAADMACDAREAEPKQNNDDPKPFTNEDGSAMTEVEKESSVIEAFRAEAADRREPLKSAWDSAPPGAVVEDGASKGASADAVEDGAPPPRERESQRSSGGSSGKSPFTPGVKEGLKTVDMCGKPEDKDASWVVDRMDMLGHWRVMHMTLEDKAYAQYVAMVIDRAAFWGTLITYFAIVCGVLGYAKRAG